jgi:tRNA modification GTPase
MAGFSNLLDTVAAVSTPRGKGGVALIRVSGPDALAICGRVFFARSGRSPGDEPRHAFFGEIRFPDGCRRAGETVDTGLATYFRAPASFTGEDTVEICCHGGALVTATVLEAVLCAGARQAEKGEFSRRAFASGKLSLPEAEALGLLIDAESEDQLKLSRAGVGGALTAACESLRAGITALLADVYARIDFPEEDLGSLPDDEVRARTDALAAETERLLGTYRTGRAVAEGIETVICGRTNTGKSTLYNRLTGAENAIVTGSEGTTRDVLCSTVSFGGATLRLCDTAGIRGAARDEAEVIGIGRTVERIDGAELVLFLIDGSREPDADDISLAERLRGARGQVIALLTKCDLGPARPGALELFRGFPAGEAVSAVTGEGIDRLESRVRALFIDGELDLGRDSVVTTARQFRALETASEALREAGDAICAGFTADVVSVCLERAASALTELDGRGAGAVSADVIEEIFSRFCVGK